MTLQDRLEISPEVVARDMGGETMLLDLASGTYFGLDPVGALVWQCLEDGGSLAAACDRVSGEFEVARPVLEADVIALALQLVEKGLAQAA